MKKVAFFLLLCFLIWDAFSQVQVIPRAYQLREANAAPAVQSKINALRTEIASKNLTYIVGITSKIDLPIEKITGLIPPSSDVASRLQGKVRGYLLKPRFNLSLERIRELKDPPWPGNPYFYGSPTQSKLDLRQGGYVSPVSDQGVYGSCWAFSAMAAYESSYKILTKNMINTSEEYIVNCSGAGNWGGGWMQLVFDWMVDNQKNTENETALPYTGPPANCPSATPSTNYYAVDWGMVDPNIGIAQIPSVEKMKEAICKYGAIATGLVVIESFKYYAGGYYFETASGTMPNGIYVNHGVVIIGWDDSTGSWLIKNSWGTDWGSTCDYGTEKGYMWIKYNSSNIGAYSSWVRASTIAH
jgi:cathepsin K